MTACVTSSVRNQQSTSNQQSTIAVTQRGETSLARGRVAAPAGLATDEGQEHGGGQRDVSRGSTASEAVAEGVSTADEAVAMVTSVT